MTTEIKLKRGTAANLAAINPVLAAGEPCWESNTNKFKIGDGTTHWIDLPYAADSETDSAVHPFLLGGM